MLKCTGDLMEAFMIQRKHEAMEGAQGISFKLVSNYKHAW